MVHGKATFQCSFLNTLFSLNCISKIGVTNPRGMAESLDWQAQCAKNKQGNEHLIHAQTSHHSVRIIHRQIRYCSSVNAQSEKVCHQHHYHHFVVNF